MIYGYKNKNKRTTTNDAQQQTHISQEENKEAKNNTCYYGSKGGWMAGLFTTQWQTEALT